MSGCARFSRTRLASVLFAALCLVVCKDPRPAPPEGPPLKLVKESRISALLEGSDARKRLEASGVVAQGGDFFVVFDNLEEIARLDKGLEANKEGAVWRSKDLGEGLEGIAWDNGRFYAVIENRKVGKKRYRARILTLDKGFGLKKDREVAFDFKSENKGLEGLSMARLDGERVMLGLCEGGGCKKGKKKKRQGQVLVLKPSGDAWKVTGNLLLPKSARFADYSDIAVDGEGRVAVVSQEEGALWVGKLGASGFEGDGKVYLLPEEGGEQVYCNVEGVSWVGPSTLVMVSDKAKDDQPSRCGKKAQSIHLFEL